MTVQVDHPPELNNEDFRSIEYWKPHFSKVVKISLDYYTVTDKTKVLVVHAKHPTSTKKPVIIIPGWFSQITGWTEVTKRVSEETSIIYFETREKASSIIPNHEVEMSVERMTDDLEQIGHLIPYDIEGSVMMGSSMGGTVMLEYLSRDKKLPKTAVMIGPNPEFPQPLVSKFVLRVPLFTVNPLKRALKWYIRTFKIDMDEEPQQYRKYAGVIDNAEAWKLRQSGRECLPYKAWDKLENAEINTDVYLVGASADKMHDAEQTLKVHEAIENSEFIDFPTNKATHSSKMGDFILNLC